jgi:hypothetical protein
VQDPPKFTQIWIFGLKTNHLATLVSLSPPLPEEIAFQVHFCSSRSHQPEMIASSLPRSILPFYTALNATHVKG